MTRTRVVTNTLMRSIIEKQYMCERHLRVDAVVSPIELKGFSVSLF